MNNEQKQLDENTGVAFVNKSDNPGAPKKKGFIKVDGKVYKIAIWERISKAGNDYLHIKIDPQTSVS